MNYSTIFVGTILVMFFIFVVLRGELPLYAEVMGIS